MIKLRLSSFKRDFIYEVGFVFIATLLGFTFGYLYLVFMGRVLGPEMFGIFGSLVGIFYIACLVGQALRVAIASNVAEIKARGGESAAISALLKLGMKFSFLYLLIPLLFVTASRPISSFFHLKSTGPILILGFALFAALVLDPVLGLLQGLQRFKHFALSGYLLSQGLKLFFGVAFVWVGWDLLGAIGALLASTIIAIAAGLIPIRKQLVKAVQTKTHHDPGCKRYSFQVYSLLSLSLFLPVWT